MGFLAIDVILLTREFSFQVDWSFSMPRQPRNPDIDE